jgi:aminopeptidase N
MRILPTIALAIAACSSPAKHAVPTTSPIPTPSPAVVKALPDPAPPALRLPGDVRPTKYALDLTIVPDQPKASGRVTIDAEIVKPTRVVWLNATDLVIAKATIGGRTARVIDGGDDFVGITTDAELPTGTTVLALDFTAPIDSTKSHGIYSEKEGAETYAYTFFEPIDARRAFPCFDEPSYKVPWQLTLHVKKDHVARANAAIVREADEANGMKRVEFAVSKPMPSYLVAFVVGPFEVVDGGVGGRIKTPIQFIVPKGRALELRWAKEVTPRVVAALEDYFDMDYQYGKLDVAVVPRYWGTMEHPGIVAMGQPLTLIRPEQETRARKQSYANILAHELGHYWFGDLVTMAWWDGTWLNEALGEWMDMIITDNVEPKWRYRDERVGISRKAMSSDEALATQAMRQPVTTREGIGASFDNGITYYKGASLFRMFEASVGAEKWRDAIRAYMRAHAWGSATAEDLLTTLSDKLGPQTASAIRTFLDQPGVPLITAKLSCSGKTGKLALHQRRALPAGVKDTVTNRTWKVPVCVRYGDATAQRACIELDAADGELALDRCPTWFILNGDATGYYRSSVDPAMAKALFTPSSAIAKAAKPTASEKMMLVADLRAMVDRDELTFDKLLELVPLVAADPDDKVAAWAFEAASFATSPLDDDLYAKSKKYYTRTFGPRAKKLGWTRAKTDSDERHELRRKFVPAVAIEDAALSKQAEALADRWVAEQKGVEDDLVYAVLSTATAHGNAARFDKILAAAKKARDRTDQQRLLLALGGFRDPAIAAKALEVVRGTEFDLRDSLGIFYRVVFRRETRTVGTKFVTEQIDALLARMRDDEASWFLGALAGGPCTVEQRTAMANLVATRAAKYSGAEIAVKRGLEQSQQCIDSAARQLPALKRVLAKY